MLEALNLHLIIFQVSGLGFGCGGLSGILNAPLSHEAGCSILKEAFNKGITFFDTANVYGHGGHNEIMVGKVCFIDEKTRLRKQHWGCNACWISALFNIFMSINASSFIWRSRINIITRCCWDLYLFLSCHINNDFLFVNGHFGIIRHWSSFLVSKSNWRLNLGVYFLRTTSSFKSKVLQNMSGNAVKKVSSGLMWTTSIYIISIGQIHLCL